MIPESHVTLPDGRRLAYAEFGRPDGEPVLYCHGSPSSRLEPLLVGDEVWARLSGGIPRSASGYGRRARMGSKADGTSAL